MGKLKDKLIDMGGYTKEGLSNLRNQDREVGPSQARMKGLKSDIGGMASKLDEIETAAKNKDKIKSKDNKPDFTPKSTADYPEYQEELETLYNRGTDPNVLQKKKKGGSIKAKCMSKGGMTASKRADGCCTKGKTKGKII